MPKSTSGNTTHRNIRFGFNPDYREAYRVFLWWQLLVPFTGDILPPYVYYRQKRFLVENSRYGTTPFRFHAAPGGCSPSAVRSTKLLSRRTWTSPSPKNLRLASYTVRPTVSGLPSR